ncbi:hypothetical protein ACFL0V_05690 [Nanoarchaeota archaeon]
MDKYLSAFASGFGTGFDPLGTLLGSLGVPAAIGHMCSEYYRNPATIDKAADRVVDKRDYAQVLRKAKRELPPEQQPDDIDSLIQQYENQSEAAKVPDIPRNTGEKVLNAAGKLAGVGSVVSLYALTFIPAILHFYITVGSPAMCGIDRHVEKSRWYKTLMYKGKMVANQRTDCTG